MFCFDGIGVNEYVVDVCYDVVDFILMVDIFVVWELNVWYYMLNCGYVCCISGEIDFFCIYGDKVGLGRVYVKFDEEVLFDFMIWVEGICDGWSYVSDGLSYLIDFKVNDLEVGVSGEDGCKSVLNIVVGELFEILVWVVGFFGEMLLEWFCNCFFD